VTLLVRHVKTNHIDGRTLARLPCSTELVS